MTSDSEPQPIHIATGITTGIHSPTPKEAKSLEKLWLVSEPESAAVHCQRMVKKCDRESHDLARAKCYLLVDIGGGTVDIASHAIEDDQIEEIADPVGNFWGGTTVNEGFSKFLQDFVDDPKFSHYIQRGTPQEQKHHEAELSRLFYGRNGFESEKLRFGTCDGGDSYRIELPPSFVRQYKDSLVGKGDILKSMRDMSVQVEDDGAVMLISYQKMAEFFKVAIKGITSLIESHLTQQNIALKIDTIYWVGGFGGCKYVRNQLKEAIDKSEKLLGCNYKISAPVDPELAVILGATFLRYDPSMVMKRKPGAGGFDPVATLPQQLESSCQTPLDLPTTPTSGGNETGKC